jgi:hypothetical protein
LWRERPFVQDRDEFAAEKRHEQEAEGEQAHGAEQD